MLETYKVLCVRWEREIEPWVFVLERQERGVRSPQWAEVELPSDVGEREAVEYVRRCLEQGEELMGVLNEVSLGRVPLLENNDRAVVRAVVVIYVEYAGPRVRVWGASRASRVTVHADCWRTARIEVLDPVSGLWTVCFEISDAQRRYVLGRAQAARREIGRGKAWD